MNDTDKKTTYILHTDGVTGYCFDTEKKEVRKRVGGVEAVIESGTEEMGRANDARTGMTPGYGVGEKGEEITEEEYLKL